VFKLGIGLGDIVVEVTWFGVERSKVKVKVMVRVRVRIQQFGMGSNSMSAF